MFIANRGCWEGIALPTLIVNTGAPIRELIVAAAMAEISDYIWRLWIWKAYGVSSASVVETEIASHKETPLLDGLSGRNTIQWERVFGE